MYLLQIKYNNIETNKPLTHSQLIKFTHIKSTLHHKIHRKIDDT